MHIPKSTRQRLTNWPQFAEETYQVEVSGTNLYQLNRAISSGATAGVFALPKGPSGKVKLAPKKKPTSDDEVCDDCDPGDVMLTHTQNSKPAPAKKPVVKKAPVKKAEAPPKKAAAKETATARKGKKPAAAKKSTTTKKVTTAPAPKKAAPKKTTAGAPAKKPVAKSAASAKKASTAKTAEKKVSWRVDASCAALTLVSGRSQGCRYEGCQEACIESEANITG